MASDETQIRRRLKEIPTDAKPKKTVVTAMQKELRTHIVVLLNERTASRPEICRELGAHFDKVRYEMDVLKKLDPPLIELVGEKPVRGTVEKFYRATSRARINESEWSGVPDVIKGSMRGTLLDMIANDAVAAISGGTYDFLENAHMSWTPMLLDERGWNELVVVLRLALEEVERIKGESGERLLAEDAKGTSCTVSILGYPSANDDRKVGPSINMDERASQGERPKEKAKKVSKKNMPRRAKTTRKGSSGKATQKSKRRKSAGK